MNFRENKAFIKQFRCLHFVGIGGIGMSGIAEVMLNLGYRIQGSDIKRNANINRLEKRGAKIFIGHDESHIQNVDALVISSAVRKENPEVVAARRNRIPVVKRAQMLSELMRLKYSIAIAGTHGKTTTTSLVACLMDRQGYDPTVINGGIINAYHANAKLGTGDWMIVEADESDGSFTKLSASLVIVTNIDAEHMDHYGSFEAMAKAYEDFVENLPFYGCAVLCADHPNVQTLHSGILDRRVLTYGFSPQADIRAENIRFEEEASFFDLVFKGQSERAGEVWKNIELAMYGEYNIQNATAAIAVTSLLGIEEPHVRVALREFSGVKRRFTKVALWRDIQIIDDYGHHPIEISKVLEAARQASHGRVIAVCQPHRYSRLQALFEDFCSCFHTADYVFITPVYAAGESPVSGYDSEALVEGIWRHGHQNAYPINQSNMAEKLLEIANPKDMIVFLGAGDITQWAYALKEELEKLAGELA